MNDAISLLGPGVLLAAPILYAALGGLFTQRAGIFNIGLEGFMLLAAYFAVNTAVDTESLFWGTVAGVAAASTAAVMMAVLVVGFRADEVIVGIAINVLALGLTTFLFANAQGSGRSLELKAGFPSLHLSWLDNIAVLGPLFNDRDVIVWALVPAVAVVALVFGRTSFGLQLKAAGEAPLAARAAGVRVAGVRFASIVISGAFCGVAGAELAIGSVHLFSENMTSGRGIIAFAAVIFGAGRVSRTAAACLLFGYAQALAGLLQIRTDFPSQFVLMVPFLLTIIAITSSDALRGRRPRPHDGVASQQVFESTSHAVVVAGHLSIDEIRHAHGQILEAATGGAAAYAALGAFLAQGDVVVVARVGDDYPVGQLELAHVDAGRIHTDEIRVMGGRSIHNIAHYGADGSRTYDIESFKVMTEQTPVPADLRGMELHGRWALIAPATLPQQKALAEALKAAGAMVALDTELHYLTGEDALQRLQEVTRIVDCFLPSREHLQHLFGSAADMPVADTSAMAGVVAAFGCALTIVKCGRDGVIVFAADADADAPDGVRVPAVPDIDVVDPTGAGDGFNGGCLAGFARGERPTAASVTGCVAASFVIQSIGIHVPDVFSGPERATRYRNYSGNAAVMTEREELV